eukprot:CAMPEP_0206593970 /NCGR_PEP_ID=MMETSP0325_2-20121206/42052_1 /ASSEMBLY_ACC=CAM_ASM_000347 /TAXON_ID=2866 /ORGANISM="Crypthecodinium cohnii, Strain Seligo" /LENGTH=247 /DNA_ID=CAMNT_0054104255 /DNA_START=207 /DNA_END=950 /DNA_ORIENTATION=-
MLTYRLPSIVGACGIFFGFIGLVGAYDDRHSWVLAFNRFLVLKLVAMIVTMLADQWELEKCDTWLDNDEYKNAVKFGKLGVNYQEGNPALAALAEEHVCSSARWAYMLGFAIDFTLWAYFAWKAFSFEQELKHWTPYPIDFGRDPDDAEARWKLYGVKDPRADQQRLEARRKENQGPFESIYGSFLQGSGEARESHARRPTPPAANTTGVAGQIPPTSAPAGRPPQVPKLSLQGATSVGAPTSLAPP